jgi:hypothetical protein
MAGRPVPFLQVLLAFYLLLNLEESFEEGFWSWRAAGNVDIDGKNFVHAFDDRVAELEEAAAIGAGPHGDDIAGLRHLVEETTNAQGHLVSEGAGDHDEVGRSRTGPGCGSEPFEVRSRSTRLHELNGTASKTKE